MTWLRRHWGLLTTITLMAITIFNGLRSIDFGFHWDEPVHLATVKQALADETFLPAGFYHYPSLLFFLTVLSRLGQRVLQPLGVGQTDAEFFLIGRSVFLILTVLGALFLFLAAKRIAGQFAGVFAASVYLLSWQMTYHSRWIAPDALLASLTAVFIWTLIRRMQSPQARLARMAPYIVAGLAASTKYQGAFLLAGALCLDLLLRGQEDRSARSIIVETSKGLSVFFVTFVVITPGVLIQPLKVYAAIRDRAEHYSDGHGFHLGAQSEVLEEPTEFGAALVRSITLDLPSQSALLSLIISAMAIAGIALLSRANWRLTTSLLVGPVLFFLYSITLVVFIIRNFLLFHPFLSFFAAIALGALWKWSARWLYARLSLAILLVLFIMQGVTHQTIDASAIQSRSSSQLAYLVAERISPDLNSTCVRATDEALQLLTRNGVSFTHRERNRNEAEVSLILSNQLSVDAPVELSEWPGTESRWFDVIGTREVDFSHYPRWSGDQKALVFSPEQLTYIGLDSTELNLLGLSRNCLASLSS